MDAAVGMLFNVLLECCICSQRKNLHLHMVLASIPGLPEQCRHSLQDCHRLQSLHQSLCPAPPLQVWQYLLQILAENVTPLEGIC